MNKHEQDTGKPPQDVLHYSVIEMGRACAEEGCVSAAEVVRLLRNGRRYDQLVKNVRAHKEAVISASRSAVRVCDYDRELWGGVE